MTVITLLKTIIILDC